MIIQQNKCIQFSLLPGHWKVQGNLVGSLKKAFTPHFFVSGKLPGQKIDFQKLEWPQSNFSNSFSWTFAVNNAIS